MVTTASTSESQDERAALTSRVIPTMTLSTAANPLTAPLPYTAARGADRATERFRVEGNVVLTGGAGTLALAAARALLEHGANQVVLMDLQSTFSSSDEALTAFSNHYKNPVKLVRCDVTTEDEVEAAFEEARSIMGSIDILCCFAGIVGCAHSLDVPANQFRKVLDVNLTGSFLCAQAAAKHMIDANNGGSILFTASISAHATNYPQPQTAYNASKAGIVTLTQNLAAEWAVHGIRVNCLSPGYMDTVLNAGDNLKPVRDVWASRCPMGRMGDVEEITGPVVLLCSRRAGRYITGTDLRVDGGALCF